MTVEVLDDACGSENCGLKGTCSDSPFSLKRCTCSDSSYLGQFC